MGRRRITRGVQEEKYEDVKKKRKRRRER